MDNPIINPSSEPETEAGSQPTEEQWAQAMEWLRAHPYGDQDGNL